MSGFDFPPASDSSTPIGSLTQRFDSLRQTFQTEREERAAARERQHGLPTPPPTMPRPRRRIASSRGSGSLSNPHRPRSPVLSSPAYPPRDTPRITDRLRQVAAGTRAQLRRLRQEMSEDNQDIADQLRDRRELLDRMSSHLDGILNSRTASSSSSLSAEDELSSHAETETRLRSIDPTSVPRRRSNKRRKLDHDGDMAMLEPYGYCGQVVPGQLKMEIVSCDGGEYPARDPRSLHLEHYRAENVLRNDGSVYCTKSSRCNMMLRQRGEALFHLDSLVIAAPKRGYTAPIQQGLVFVGMSAEKLSVATSSYSIQYSDDTTHETMTRSPTPQERDYERLSLLEAVNDNQMRQAPRSRYHFTEPPYILPPPRPSQPRVPRSFPAFSPSGRFLLDSDDYTSSVSAQGNAFLDNCDWPPITDSSITSSGLTRAPTPPPFTVTTVMESSDDDYERGGREISYGAHGFPPHMLIDQTDSDTDGDDASDASIARRLFRLNSLRHARPVRRSSPGQIAHHLLDDEESGAESLEPNARFFMPENDCRITIKFHPPVAGKFILLKLFSPQLRDGGNIDIEYVAAHGYSGPRFFPSVEMK